MRCCPHPASLTCHHWAPAVAEELPVSVDAPPIFSKLQALLELVIMCLFGWGLGGSGLRRRLHGRWQWGSAKEAVWVLCGAIGCLRRGWAASVEG
ncbi:hypothetical protein Ahy_A03g011298 isoform A [Arachis hypogaea]|uniref:Uncharacterized protein n=1 Tax=Arachis hypogaea TaxID=3818 RepID=A0A445DQC4_ARAHY|nr:hypothetical protein Ahy_A03g011298 isoform A [Arachis hypogaea]